MELIVLMCKHPLTRKGQQIACGAQLGKGGASRSAVSTLPYHCPHLLLRKPFWIKQHASL